MALIEKATLDLLTDRAAYMEGNLAAAVAGGVDFGTTVLDTEDMDVVLPMDDAAYAVDQRISGGAWMAGMMTELVRGLIAHAQRLSGTKATAYDTLSALLTAVGTRAHIWFDAVQFRVTGAHLTPALVYDSVKTIGTYTGTGSGTGSFVHAVALSALTGGNNLVAVATTTATAIVLDLTCKKPDGTTEVKRVTVNGDAGTSADIGTHGTNLYTDVPSGVIVTGGSNGQVVEVRSEEDRAPAL